MNLRLARSLPRRLREHQRSSVSTSPPVPVQFSYRAADLEYVCNATRAQFGLTSQPNIKPTRYTPIRP
jgi:hypothetical protein